MSGSSVQICTMYEELGHTPEQIAEYLGDLDASAVKMILAANSSMYREELRRVKKNIDLIKPNHSYFSDDEAEEAAQIVLSLARCAENETVRYRAAKYVHDDFRGRHDKNFTSLKVNVHVLNEQFKRAREAKELAKQKVIDVPSSECKLQEV